MDFDSNKKNYIFFRVITKRPNPRRTRILRDLRFYICQICFLASSETLYCGQFQGMHSEKQAGQAFGGNIQLFLYLPND